MRLPGELPRQEKLTMPNATVTHLSRALCAAAFLSLIASTPAANAAPIPPARHELQAIYHKIDAAIDQKDVDTAFDYDAEDCEYYNKKGHLVDEGSGRQEVVDILGKADTVKETTTITSFAGSHTDATVTTKAHVVLLLSNRINGRAARIVLDSMSRDYWVKTDDGWKRKRTRELKSAVALHKNF